VRSALAAALFLSTTAAPLAAQSPARVGLETAVAIDLFRGDSAAARPNIVGDVTALVRLGDRWTVYLRPWFRQPRGPGWDTQIYQAAVQYQRSGRVSTRIDAGYIASPIGLGMADTRPEVNPTIAPHLSYFTPMPTFDPGAPRVVPVAASYPLGGQLTLSGRRWDARAAVVNAAPTRVFVINGRRNPPRTPAFVGGGGLSLLDGMRLGVSLARGIYVSRTELSEPAGFDRAFTLVALEGEYALGHTRIVGEVTRDRLQTSSSTETAYVWFLQGVRTLSPRWFVAARQEGTSAPPAPAAGLPRPAFHATEATAGYRLSPELTLRAGVLRRKAFTKADSDWQVGWSLVWAERWW
jgi:hypothetical protein